MILDGKKVRDEILKELKDQIEKEKLSITLAIILVGDNASSKIYIKNKENACKQIGINVENYFLEEDVSEKDLIHLIEKLNQDSNVTGIILQSPVPSHINYDKVSNFILSSKDIDGFTKENIYNLYLNKETILPCTVRGIIELFSYYHIDLKGQNVLVVGRGNIVGHPLSLALTNENATVTLAHSQTKNLKKLCLAADIIISATGIPHLIKEDMVKTNSVVVDVGVNRIEGKIVGDVDYEAVALKCKYITPNPGGVGPMTVAMIMKNLVEVKRRGMKNG